MLSREELRDKYPKITRDVRIAQTILGVCEDHELMIWKLDEILSLVKVFARHSPVRL